MVDNATLLNSSLILFNGNGNRKHFKQCFVCETATNPKRKHSQRTEQTACKDSCHWGRMSESKLGAVCILMRDFTKKNGISLVQIVWVGHRGWKHFLFQRTLFTWCYFPKLMNHSVYHPFSPAHRTKGTFLSINVGKFPSKFCLPMAEQVFHKHITLPLP